MAEEAAPPAEAEGAPKEETTEEQRVPLERFKQVNKQAKEAKERATALEQQIADLKAQMDERDNAGLPELERERKRAEQLEKRLGEAEAKAEQATQQILIGQRKSWVTNAAQAQGFADPSDASAFVNLEEIEDEKDAERAVKRLAGQKKHLLRAEEPALPGRVLQNGQPATVRGGGVNPAYAEAEQLANDLKKFIDSRR